MSSAASTIHQGRLRTRVAVFVCVAVALIALDQITKFIAVEQLSDGSSHTVIPRALSFRLLYNPGATLGMGSGSTWVISVAAIVACVVLAVFALRTVSVKWTVALSIAFAGAAGNLIDRIIHADGFLNGKVTDFLDYGWSVGNVADAYLTVAAVAIVILVIMSEPFSADSAKTAKKVGNGSENE